MGFFDKFLGKKADESESSCCGSCNGQDEIKNKVNEAIDDIKNDLSGKTSKVANDEIDEISEVKTQEEPKGSCCGSCNGQEH